MKNTYSEKLKDPRWQDKRLRVLVRDKFACKLCNDSKTTLDIHHIIYTGEPYEAPLNHLITLCRFCHELVSKYPDNYYRVYRKKVKIVRIAILSDRRAKMFLLA